MTDLLQKAHDNLQLAKMDIEEAMRGFIICPCEDAQVFVADSMRHYKERHADFRIAERVMNKEEK